MQFEKNGEVIQVSLYRCEAILDDGCKFKISGLREKKTTMEKISFLEGKGYRHIVSDAL